MTDLRIVPTGPAHPVFAFARLVAEPVAPATVSGSALADAVRIRATWPLLEDWNWCRLSHWEGGVYWWHPVACPSGVIAPR